jgi:hypothetical protein
MAVVRSGLIWDRFNFMQSVVDGKQLLHPNADIFGLSILIRAPVPGPP